MNYLMLVCVDESVKLSKAEWATMTAEVKAWVAGMDASGVRLLGNQLAPASDATTVRVRDGEVLLGHPPVPPWLDVRPDLERAESGHRVLGRHLDGLVQVGAFD